jgi:exodeoxyribonuclease-5
MMNTSTNLDLTPQQGNAIRQIFGWLAESTPEPFILGGYAGTGKSTLTAITRLILRKKRPKWRVAFASFTGKATRVLDEKLKEQKAKFPGDHISTLHSLLYAPVINSSGHITDWIRKTKFPYQLLIVDEASMITEEIWRDIRLTGMPVLAVGDHGQLPPIGSTFNLMAQPDFTLETIHRQVAGSPILEVARLAREVGKIPVQKFGPGVQKFDATSSEAQVLMDDFFQSYKNDTIFLTGFNTSRVKINASIRAALWRESNQPESGDLVVCLKNDWELGIYNGMTGTLSNVQVEERDGDTTISYTADITDDLGNLLYSGKLSAEQFNQPTTLKYSKVQQREIGQLFDYGYALTVHKAQGSQARKVIVLEERSKHTANDEWRRWLYTAVTRAEEELYIFGRDD